MSEAKAYGNTKYHLELNRYADNSLSLLMSQDHYFVLNGSAVDLEGATLSELADSDSMRAYTFIKKALRTVATDSTYVAVNGACVAEKSQDGSAATDAIAYTALLQRMPDCFTAFHFSIGLYPTETDVELLGESPDTVIPILDFRVEPTSLAM